MGIQENMSNVMRALKAQRRLSITEFSEELDVSRTVLQDYLNGKGNPRADTIEHLAAKLKLDPATLVSGGFDEAQFQIAFKLLDTIEAVSKLSSEQKKQFTELFLQMILLLEEGE